MQKMAISLVSLSLCGLATNVLAADASVLRSTLAARPPVVLNADRTAGRDLHADLASARSPSNDLIEQKVSSGIVIRESTKTTASLADSSRRVTVETPAVVANTSTLARHSSLDDASLDRLVNANSAQPPQDAQKLR